MIHIQPYMDILYHFMIHISELAVIGENAPNGLKRKLKQ